MRNFIRFILRAIFRTFKIRFNINFDLDKLPKKGVYISNHVSYLDPVVLFAFLPGNPIFALHGQLARRRWIRWLMKSADVIEFNPIEPMDIKALIEKVKDGRLCMIFPEGRITSDGGLTKIYEAPGLVADKAKAPIIPILIKGLEYSYFSKTKGNLHRRPMPRSTVVVNSPIAFKLKDELRRQRDHISNEVYMIMREMIFNASYFPNKSLFATLMKTAKVNSKKSLFTKRQMFFEDINRQPNTYKDLLIKSFVLGKVLKRKSHHFENIGVMLPTTLACLVTFLGLSMYERIPAMLNFSVGLNSLLSMCKTASLKKIITSKLFIKNANLDDIVKELKEAGYEIIFLEDLRKDISLFTKINSVLKYKIRRIPHRAGGDKPCAILFTSGSEGEPKGVVLTHANIIANVKQLSSTITITSQDCLLNVLPMFHSFGLIATMLPLLEGCKLFLYPSPLHYRIVSQLAYEISATVFIGTDTFLRGYAKIAHPLDFQTLRFIYAGAEAVKKDTRNIWMERFGVKVMEAYGTTECTPAVTFNNETFNRFGSIGKLLPGIEHKIVPVEGIETGGELWVKGPNIMKGYLRPENPGVLEPTQDGWYNTGDVVEIDEIGFLYVKDRIKRFAKIGGEMVSLNAVDNMIREAHQEFGDEFSYGIVAIPHDTKGEQIVCITNNKAVSSESIHKFIKQSNMSELFLPRQILFKKEMPVLGSGKMDNIALKKWVIEQQ
ncbi:MAG: AMP-binding protein [Alphaproteobacteria bacterium]